MQLGMGKYLSEPPMVKAAESSLEWWAKGLLSILVWHSWQNGNCAYQLPQ